MSPNISALIIFALIAFLSASVSLDIAINVDKLNKFVYFIQFNNIY